MLSTRFNFLIVLFTVLLSQSIYATPLRILPLGDSITSGDGPDGAGALPSYRRDLWHSLVNAGYDVDFVGSRSDYANTPIPQALQDFDPDYEGWPGETAAQLNSALNSRMANYTPDVVLLHIGTNDILAANYSTAQDTAILSEIGGIISKLRTKNANVIILLAEIIPIGANNTDAEDFNIKLANEISDYDNAAPNSPGIVLIDQHSGFVSPDDYWDNPPIHPNASGEQKMAAQWLYQLTQQPAMAQAPVSTSNIPINNGLTLWLDATDTDADGVVDAISNQEVTLWEDKSGNQNDVSQISGAGAPSILANSLNNKSTLDFDQDGLEAPDADQITANSSYTKFAVFKFDSEDSNNIISSTKIALWEGDSGAIRVWHGEFAPNYVMTSPDNIVNYTSYHIVATRYGQPNGVDNIINLDGTDVNTKPKDSQEGHAAAATNIGSLGSGFFLNGKIAEALIYDRALTDAEISQVESYLSTKWGLPLNNNPVGPADATQSIITASPVSVIANGIATTTITLQAKDSNGINLSTGGDTIIFSHNGSATLSSETDNGNGTYTATISNPVAEQVTITAMLNSTPVTDTATVTFTPVSSGTSATIIPIIQLLLLETE